MAPVNDGDLYTPDESHDAILHEAIRSRPAGDVLDKSPRIITNDPADWAPWNDGHVHKRYDDAFSLDGGKTYTLAGERTRHENGISLVEGPLHTSENVLIDDLDQLRIDRTQDAAHKVRDAITAIQAVQLDMTEPVTLRELEDNQVDLQIEVELQRVLTQIHRRVLTRRVDVERERARKEREGLAEEERTAKYGNRVDYSNAGTRRLEGEAI